MRCAWQDFLSVLPIWMREFVDKHGNNGLLELRLRISSPPILVFKESSITMHRNVTVDDLNFCIHMVTKYSPWSSTSASKLYYTAPGGHRIGMCGDVIITNGQVSSIGRLSSLCIRIARDFLGIAKELKSVRGSILIIGPPGSGKTTLLRDYLRQLSLFDNVVVTVIDERQEIFPKSNGLFSFDVGMHTDVISGCGKAAGIECALRNMGPTVIAIDEITAEQDCRALIHAGWCGVDLIATAHAATKEDLLSREIYRPLVEMQLFDYLVVMNRDKSWCVERLVYGS